MEQPPDASRDTRAPRRTVILSAVGVAVAVGLTVGVAAATGQLPGQTQRGTVKVPGADDGSWSQLQLPDTKAGRSYSFGGPRICLDGDADQATIERVELLDPKGGLSVRHFSVHELDADFDAGSLGSAPRPLEELGWPVDGPQLLRTKCFGSTETGEGEGTTGVSVEVTKPTDATAGASGVQVHWRMGNRRGEALVPFAIVLCERDEDHCANFIPDDK